MEEDELVPGIGGGTIEVRMNQDFEEVRQDPTQYVIGLDMYTETGNEPWAYQAVNVEHGTRTTVRGVGQTVTAVEAGATLHRQTEEMLQDEVNQAFQTDENVIPAVERPMYAQPIGHYRNIDNVQIINLGNENRHLQQEMQIERMREMVREQGYLTGANIEDSVEPVAEQARGFGQLYEEAGMVWRNPTRTISYTSKEELKEYFREMQQANKISISVCDEIIDKINTY